MANPLEDDLLRQMATRRGGLNSAVSHGGNDLPGRMDGTDIDLDPTNNGDDPYPIGEEPTPEIPATPTQPPANPEQPQQGQPQVPQQPAQPGQPQAAGTNYRDIVQKTYEDILKRAQVPVTRNDANIRLQSDAYGAGVDRQRRNYLSDVAESSGPYATGAMKGENRMASERAGQMVGGFEADLIGREISSRRDEVMAALNGLYGTVSDLEHQNLSRELAQLNSQLQYAQMGQSQRQFEDRMGYDIGRDEVNDNWRIMQMLWDQ